MSKTEHTIENAITKIRHFQHQRMDIDARIEGAEDEFTKHMLLQKRELIEGELKFWGNLLQALENDFDGGDAA